jgi:hypothetical protein
MNFRDTGLAGGTNGARDASDAILTEAPLA